MKKNLLYATCLMGVVALTACDNEMDGNLTAGNGQWTVEASMDMGSRTALKEDNKTVVWSEGDGIYLFGGTSEATMTLDKGAGEATGEFVGNVEGKVADLKNALYPVPEVKDGKYTFELPTTRKYSENSAAPMIGTLEKNHVTFENLMALVRIPLKELEAKENVVKLTMLGGSIAGTATVDIDNKTLDVDGPVNEVVVTIPSRVTECNVDIPVPAGTYDGYLVELNGNIKYYYANGNKQILGKENVLIADNEEGTLVNNVDDLRQAATEGKTWVILENGTYTHPEHFLTENQEITIVGNKEAIMNITKLVYPSDKRVIVNFKGITINGNGYTNGLANTCTTYTDCRFSTAEMYLYHDSEFINCTFDDTENYALWTWGAKNVEFKNCIFNTTGKALYVNANNYGEPTNYQKVVIENCKFYDIGENNIQKAAIETGDDFNLTIYDIFITNTIVEGFSVTEDKTEYLRVYHGYEYGGNDFGTNVWGNKYLMGTDKLNVVIDGVDVH